MNASADKNEPVVGVLTRSGAAVASTHSSAAQGPAFVAGQRTPATNGAARGYPTALGSFDATGASVVLAATRALLTAKSRVEVARVLHTAVEDLGGAVVSARSAPPEAMPVDVSLGVGEPQLVVVDQIHPASMGLTSHLPTLVEDALTAAARCEGDRRRPVRVTLDGHRVVDARTVVVPRLGRATVGDVVCLVDLDNFKLLIESRGVEAAHLALDRCGALLRSHVRTPGDFVGPCEDDRFVVILAGAPLDVACDRMRQVSLAWMAEHEASVSVGVAVCSEHGGVAAQEAADRALRRAKQLGRNRLAIATSEDAAGAAGLT
jgi:diguanylate cyclase (GGDEF)-like protein